MLLCLLMHNNATEDDAPCAFFLRNCSSDACIVDQGKKKMHNLLCFSKATISVALVIETQCHGR